MWPAENEFVSDEFVEVGATLTISELMLAGVTCLNDQIRILHNSVRNFFFEKEDVCHQSAKIQILCVI